MTKLWVVAHVVGVSTGVAEFLWIRHPSFKFFVILQLIVAAEIFVFRFLEARLEKEPIPAGAPGQLGVVIQGEFTEVKHEDHWFEGKSA